MGRSSLTSDAPRTGTGIHCPARHGYDLERVDEWCEQLPRDQQVVLYCLYGFWVSEDTAEALRARGFDAHILQGGISAWRAMGFPTEPL